MASQHLAVSPNIDEDPWPETIGVVKAQRGKTGDILKIGRLPKGTNGEKSTVMLLVVSPDGMQMIVETSLMLFHFAHEIMIESAAAEGETFTT